MVYGAGRAALALGSLRRHVPLVRHFRRRPTAYGLPPARVGTETVWEFLPCAKACSSASMDFVPFLVPRVLFTVLL